MVCEGISTPNSQSNSLRIRGGLAIDCLVELPVSTVDGRDHREHRTRAAKDNRQRQNLDG